MALLASLVALSAALAGTVIFDTSLGTFTRDPATVAGLPTYAGSVSSIGVVLWCVAATVSLFTALVLWQARGWSQLTAFLLAGGLLTGHLLLDDLFLLHDRAYQELFQTERAGFIYATDAPTYMAYVLALGAYLIYFRRLIARTPSVVLSAALVLMVLSGVADSLSDLDERGAAEGTLPFLLEDGTKLLGIALWAGYFTRVALSALVDALMSPGVSPSGGRSTSKRSPAETERH